MSDVTVVLSDRLSDIDRAMALVHDGFVDAGFITPQPSGRRFIPHYLTPGTAVVLGHLDGQEASACVCVPDGPWGLPSEHAFPEVRELREGRALMEVGSLVVADEHRFATRLLFTHVIATSIRVLAERDLQPVITVGPEQERFYRSMFGFDRIGPERGLYGAPAVLLTAPVTVLLDHLAHGAALARRTMFHLITAPRPAWLEDRRVEAPVRVLPVAATRPRRAEATGSGRPR